MKVILYTATTINGMLATKDGKTPWSDEEFKGLISYVSPTINATSRTFEIEVVLDYSDRKRNRKICSN